MNAWQRAKLLRELGPLLRDLVPLTPGAAALAGHEYNLGRLATMHLTQQRYEEWEWIEHHFIPKAGTPALLPEQKETFEGANRHLLQKARDWRMNGHFARSGLFYALLSAGATALVMPNVKDEGIYRFALIAGILAASIIFMITLVPIVRRRDAKSIGKLFQPSREWALRRAVKRIPLKDLPGEAIRSGTLWNLGLGQRLAHLSLEERETAHGLAGEVGENLAELVEISRDIINPGR